jgi:hypothetical protein
MWESRLSGSARGRVTPRAMGEIVWHRQETRRLTEKTNLALQLGTCPIYSKRTRRKRRQEESPLRGLRAFVVNLPCRRQLERAP